MTREKWTATLEGHEKLAAQTFTPTDTKVAVQLRKAPKPGNGEGLVFPDGTPMLSQWTQCSPEAQVVAVGPEVKQVKRGDFVIFWPGVQGWLIKHRPDGVELLIVNETQIMGVVD
jgi:co-chaperonin GroES (HSP10)